MNNVIKYKTTIKKITAFKVLGMELPTIKKLNDCIHEQMEYKMKKKPAEGNTVASKV